MQPDVVAYKNSMEDPGFMKRMKSAVKSGSRIEPGEAIALIAVNGQSVLRSAAALNIEPEKFISKLSRDGCIGDTHPIVRAANITPVKKDPRAIGDIISSVSEDVPSTQIGAIDRVRLKAYNLAARKGKTMNGASVVGFLEGLSHKLDGKGYTNEATNLGKAALEAHQSWMIQERSNARNSRDSSPVL